jgi:phospholipase D1/2
MEIALKIANKIKANERFSAYIVIPMRPEGDPTDPIIQQILYWQVNHMILSYKSTIRFTNQYEQIIVIYVG